MGIAEDFMRSFYEQYPEARRGELTLPQLNKLMAEFQEKANNAPEADFDGLSPTQMNVLLRDPFSATSLLQFNKAMDQHLDKVPLFQLSELLIAEIRDAGKLKLTVRGNLPVHVCQRLVDRQLIKWLYKEFDARLVEQNIPYIWALRYYLLDQGIIKKRNNTLSLTQKGEKLMGEHPATRFISLFLFFAGRFNWQNFHGLEDNGKCGQLGWAYSLVLLGKYGDKARSSEFYSLKLIQAFEKEFRSGRETGQGPDSIKTYHHVYAIRFFDHFADWFGLVNIERGTNRLSFFDHPVVSKSILFDRLFESIPPGHQT